MDSPNREVVLEGECYVGIDIHLLDVLLASRVSFQDVLYLVLFLKLHYPHYVGLGIWRGQRLRCQVPLALAHFMKEDLIERLVCQF